MDHVQTLAEVYASYVPVLLVRKLDGNSRKLTFRALRNAQLFNARERPAPPHRYRANFDSTTTTTNSSSRSASSTMSVGLLLSRQTATFGARAAYRYAPSMLYASGGARYFSATRLSMQNGVNAQLSTENVKPGTEGAHKRDTTTYPEFPTPHSGDRGDWVLFHPVYSQSELKAVQVLRHQPENMRDRTASWFVRALRKGYDFVSGYHHKPIPPGSTMSIEELRKGGYILSADQWLNRILFLETIAGVPGFFAAMIRHLRGLRGMKRDGGWIHTLLEEAENERMHLMTFMTLRQSGIFFRAFIVAAQGVFANAFFLAYLVSPRTCHRFVGSLEEEATLTYTALIEDMEAGRVPEWKDKPAPGIAIDYWRLKPNATLLDVIYAVRSDETTHRFVNHTLANLKPDDINPFALAEPSMHVKGVKAGFSREEAAQYLKETQQKADEALSKEKSS
ncbi:related to alternative oxidase precursor, mitochondrial [Serendipita indica DSM 11827]|uniref:Alternative oxidase n=2 Tax=Serendipita indica (strain DSM 11827) TaxID=1109443 RepID=G4TWU0_SERID|nr:related to alternative oxidase precursor, mitochondrial [Serendipita indica DSM 11827]